jgi:hypothetical protein
MARYLTEEEINQIIGIDAHIPQGTIVLARRKDGFEQQGVYFGYCNGKHLIDANNTHVMLFDEIERIPSLTKKEAKQKVSELFGKQNTPTPQEIRNIIDRIQV